MTQRLWQQRITTDASVCHGKPCFRSTRVMVSIVLDYLAAGASTEAIIEQYPTLTSDDVQAAIAYGAWLAHQEEDQPLFTGTER